MFFWTEVYITVSDAEFFRARNLLESHGISVKTRVDTSRSRMANNYVLGLDAPFLGTGGSSTSAQVCRIFTRKEEAGRAESILAGLPRGDVR